MREETRRKYELVIDGYLSNMTMAEAYMLVYPNSSLATARIEGWKVIHNEKMSDYIEQRKAEIRDEMERKHGVTRYSLIDDQLKKKKALDVVFELAQKEVLTAKEEDLLKRMSSVIRTADVNKADEILIKMLGLFEAEKVDVTSQGEEVKNVFMIGGKEVKF
jgi:hypothetical protein